MSSEPVALIVPGLNDSGPDHWQSLWLAQRGDCRKVDLGCWDAPIRNVWLSRLDQAIGAAESSVVLVAHSLGCLAVAQWASLVGRDGAARVSAALLVAPPDVDRPGAHPLVRRFAPAPLTPLPFASILVASRDDPYASFEALGRLARLWGSRLHDVGALGHINAASAIGEWNEGQSLLDSLIGEPRLHPRAFPATGEQRARM